MIGTGQSRRRLSLQEFPLGVHWESCPGGGIHIAAHNAVMQLYARLLRNLGYDCTVKEIFVGPCDPTRP
eukprot:7260474-Prymnesium_polylepis.1